MFSNFINPESLSPKIEKPESNPDAKSEEISTADALRKGFALGKKISETFSNPDKIKEHPVETAGKLTGGAVSLAGHPEIGKTIEKFSGMADSLKTEKNPDFSKVLQNLAETILATPEKADAKRPIFPDFSDAPHNPLESVEIKYKEQESPEGKEKTDKLPCRNEHLAGSIHPETGVPFVKKIIEHEGKPLDGVFPEFNSAFDAQLPENLLKASDKVQFTECCTQLKEAIASNPELRNKFTPEQLEQIENGETPDGYTWHHDAEVGKMQLVDSEEHQKTGHTGGRSIWGGGSENR